jgi:DsbC/DsbD-like thiol-disulfide interchange protein
VGLGRLMPIRSGLVSTVIVLATASPWGRPAETEHLKVQLVSDTDSVQPGRPVLLGLHFEIERQWHIYWRNPGDSGEPPRVRWNLPAGFQAGEIQWPAPERLGSGSVIDYGYQEPVLLPVEMQTPKTTLVVGSSVTLSAEVSWLVCKDICVPGKADLTLSLPVRTAPGSVSASHALFEEARLRLPKPMPLVWRAQVTSEKDRFVLTIHGAGIGQASFFPLEAGQIDNAAPQTATALPGGMRLTLKKSDQLLKTPAMLDGVLKLNSGRVYTVSALVRSLPERSAQR